MTHPRVIVSVDGVPVSGVFFERLISLSVVDREGIQSDSVELVFNDTFPHFASPRRGAVVSVTMNTGLTGGFVGAFVIDRVEFACLPYTIKVVGHSADLRSEMKASKTRHWDQSSVKDIVSQIAGEYGLTSKISDVVSGHVYQWIGQQDESDLNFLARLAQRNGALFTIKNGTLLWLERGAGKSASGAVIPAARVLTASVIEGTCRVFETDVDRFATVKALWQDRAGAKRQEVIVKADPKATGEHVLRDPFSSKAEATVAAKASAREMVRGLIRTTCSIVGRPSLMAGQPLVFVGVRPSVDGREFILETVTHKFSKSTGLLTTFTGKLKAD